MGAAMLMLLAAVPSPLPSDKLATEDGNPLVTEDGDRIILEEPAP